jgi:Zn-dependent protease/CBS domain-containing protein
MTTSTDLTLPRQSHDAPPRAPLRAVPHAKKPWAWRIARIAGIDVYVHASFSILLAWVVMAHVARGDGALATVHDIVLVAAVFGIIVLHELGHALVARQFDIRTFDITLLPIGGVARLERIPEDPVKELLIAIAGPLVNFALAGAIFSVLAAMGTPPALHDATMAGGAMLPKLMWINLMIGVFNLTPAFPMDGGRVFRALLAMRLPYVCATDIAAMVGQGIAIVIGIAGMFSSPMLVLVAFFVWTGARAESTSVHVQKSLRGVTVGSAMATHFRVLAPRETVAHAAAHVLSGFQDDFPVVDGGAVVGVLSRGVLLRALASEARETFIADLMQKQFVLADDREALTDAMRRLDGAPSDVVPVMHDGALVGMLTSERMGAIVRASLAAA